MMGRHQYLNEDEYEVNLKDFEPQPGEWLIDLTLFFQTAAVALLFVMQSVVKQDFKKQRSFVALCT